MKSITINLSDEECQLLLDMVVDIEKWFLSGPYKEKCANQKKRISNLMRRKYEADGLKAIPNDDDLVKLYFSDPNYKNRKQREEEAKLEALERFNQKNKPA